MIVNTEVNAIRHFYIFLTKQRKVSLPSVEISHLYALH